MTHEYGHHVAANRLNPPFVAEEYGTKRWASYHEICKRTSAGELFPGNEGANYTENPGEAFAEAYRVLNLTKEGVPESAIGWDIVADNLKPDAQDLLALEQDVTSPWTGPTITHWHGSFGYGTVRTTNVKTTLDGTFVARLHAPTKARMTLVAYAGKTILGQGTTLKLQLCGQRQLKLQVKRATGTGSFTVDVAKP